MQHIYRYLREIPVYAPPCKIRVASTHSGVLNAVEYTYVSCSWSGDTQSPTGRMWLLGSKALQWNKHKVAQLLLRNFCGRL